MCWHRGQLMLHNKRYCRTLCNLGKSRLDNLVVNINGGESITRFMKTESALATWIHWLEPRTWLVVISISLVLALGSAWVLVARPSGPVAELPLNAFDVVERFIRDTIRLSFTSRHKKSSLSEDVFVAPKGLLDKDATFQWLENWQDIEDRLASQTSLPVAPLRLLDSQWQPDFAGLKE